MTNMVMVVLNLVINGIPSILKYNQDRVTALMLKVLNLVINGIPSILLGRNGGNSVIIVLNLVINGIPSIPRLHLDAFRRERASFKPCYKWNTFNTLI